MRPACINNHIGGKSVPHAPHRTTAHWAHTRLIIQLNITLLDVKNGIHFINRIGSSAGIPISANRNQEILRLHPQPMPVRAYVDRHALVLEIVGTGVTQEAFHQHTIPHVGDHPSDTQPATISDASPSSYFRKQGVISNR